MNDLLPVMPGFTEVSSLITMPHDPAVRTYQRHTLPLPPCCPFSGNPQHGSTVAISYRARGAVLEVYALGAYLKRFIGGYGDVRTMEGMIERIASDCAEAVGARVRVRARVLLQEGTLAIVTEARP